jgi:hypothetical protein
MRISDFIRELARVRFPSRAFDIPFLARALDEGIVGEEALDAALPLLVKEVDEDPHTDVWRHLYRQFPTLLAVEAGREEEASPGSMFSAAFRAQEAWERMFQKFPATADAYLVRQGRLLDTFRPEEGAALHRDLAEDLEAHAEMLESEYMWQGIFEGQFHNGIGLGILRYFDLDVHQLLAETYEFFDERGARHNPYSSATRHDRDALAIQVPILGAAILHELDVRGIRPRLRHLGGKVKVELDDHLRTAIVVGAPQYHVLDRPVLIWDERRPDERLVSLPTDPSLVGREAWERVTESPLFFKHGERLLPSNLIFGMCYPHSAPTCEMLAAMVEGDLPRRFRLVPRAQAQDLFPEDKEFGGRVFAIADGSETAERAFLEMRAEGAPKASAYRVIALLGTLRDKRVLEAAELEIDIEEGNVVGSRYRLRGDAPFTIEVGRERTDALVARARNRFMPPAPEGGGDADASGHGAGASGMPRPGALSASAVPRGVPLAQQAPAVPTPPTRPILVVNALASTGVNPGMAAPAGVMPTLPPRMGFRN